MSSTTAEAPPGNGHGDPAAAEAAIANMQATPVDLPKAVAKIAKVKDEMNDVVVESKPLIDALVRALISHTHLYAFGPGGVGKTFGVERLSKHFDLPYFYVQFRQDTKREEVFGPLKVSRLAHDEYIHATDDHLPAVELANLDEFKDAGKFTRQLLNILNERWFRDSAGRRTVPLRTAIGTTNFWIEETELEALFDRFAQRIVVEPVKTSRGFKKVLKGQLAREVEAATAATGKSAKKLTVVTRAELDAITLAARTCRVEDGIIDRVDELRKSAEGENIYMSPRRWGEGIKLAKAEAVLAGRDQVIEDDLRPFALVLLNHPDDATRVRDLCKGFRDKLTEAAEEATKGLKEIADKLAPERTRKEKGESYDFGALSEASSLLNVLKEKLDEIQRGHPGRDYTALDAIRADLGTHEQFMARAVLGK